MCIKINNRKILSGIAEIIGEADKIVDITVAIDKLDKIGLENVNAELKEKGISDEAIAKLQPIILLSGTNTEKLATLKSVLAASETGMKGVEESEFILGTLETMGLKNEIELDLTLARGLNYYTGAIFEVKALDVQIGSITGVLFVLLYIYFLRFSRTAVFMPFQSFMFFFMHSCNVFSAILHASSISPSFSLT